MFHVLPHIMDFLTQLTKFLIDQLDLIWNNSVILIWTGAIGIFLVVIISFLVHRRKVQQKALIKEDCKAKNHARFRKRDWVDFQAKKVLRKGRATIQNRFSLLGEKMPVVSRSGRPLRKPERMLILAKSVFGPKKTPTSLIKKGLPSELLEADPTFEGAPDLPDEVLYLLQSVKVFGHFEKGVFLHLCRHMETVKLSKGELLFNIGEADKWMYVVQEGQVNLYIKEDQTEIKMSEFSVGDSLHSLLSILDVLTGHAASYKTVYARAIIDSTVIRLPVEAFTVAFQNREKSIVQMVQVIMTRLQRVTFLALHNYLGLSQELLRPSGRNSLVKRGQGQILKDLAKRHNSLVDTTLCDPEDVEEKTIPVKKKPKVKDEKPKKASAPIQIKKSNSNRHSQKQIRFNAKDAVVSPEDQEVSFRRSFSASKDENPSSDSVFDENRRSSIEEDAPVDDDEMMYPLKEPEILDMVVNELSERLGVEDKDLMKDHLRLLKVCAGYQLVAEGDQEVSLYLVITGKLLVSQSIPQSSSSASSSSSLSSEKSVTLFTAETGMLTGQLAVLTGEPSFFGVTAIIDSVIVQVTRQSFYVLMRHYPSLVLNLAHTVMQTVSPFVRQIDFALDWVKIDAGKSLYKQGTKGDCMYIILHGRLRSVITKEDGKKELVAEYGRGEIVGISEALSGEPRTVSLHAIRDTELAKMPEGLVKYIKSRHPSVVTRLISLVSDKLLVNIMSMKNRPQQFSLDFLSQQTSMEDENIYGDVSSHLANLSTVAILPSSRDVPLQKFSMELQHALSHICSNVLRLDSTIVVKRLGLNALDSSHEYRLSNWLASSEDSHRIVLYQTDYEMSPWTQRCIRQADAVLVVAMGDDEPKVGDLESQVEAMTFRALKMLVLLHRPKVKRPSGTVEWLNARNWLTNHTHVQGTSRLFVQTPQSQMGEYWKKLSKRKVNRFSDFSRLARFLTGTSVALVLGGGGARGLSQLGIIKSMLEKDIPIDMVGGTSIGSFVGGLWAAHRDLDILREKLVIFSKDMGSFVSKILDLTYPFTSMFSGASFNNAIHTIFEDVQIEDLWIPYFNITTDITSSNMRVHTDGWLWRYVRASMSLSGYLPPLCDPKDGHLLMDGGYVNNLPGDVARSRGAYKVIAVDVGSENEMDFTNYGDYLSGWWLLWKRWTGRWTGRIKVPDMNDIQSRLSYISCCYLLDKVRYSDYCFYVRPPVERYQTLEFNKHKELIALGFEHGQKIFTQEWSEEFWIQLRSQLNKAMMSRSADRNGLKADCNSIDVSFTDLSEFLKKGSSSDTNIDDPLNEKFDYEPAYDSSPELSFYKRTRSERAGSLPNNMYKAVCSDGDEAVLEDEASSNRTRASTGRIRRFSTACPQMFGVYSSEDDEDEDNSDNPDDLGPLSASL